MRLDIIRMNLLRESYSYTGSNFERNYILSNLVKSFSKDNFPVNSYSSLYGEEGRVFFDYLKEHKDLVKKISKINGLLFEKIGAKNLNEHLLRMRDDDLLYLIESTEKYMINEKANINDLYALGKGKAKEYLASGTSATKGFNFETIKKAFATAKENVGGFLKEIWEQFKGLGIVQAITPYLQSGFSWVKNILGTGLDFFTQNIGSLVLPAMMLFRTAPAAISMINKARARKKAKPLTSQEEEKFKKVAEQKKAQIEAQRKKGKK